jgi:nucleoside-diphosphate kinase
MATYSKEQTLVLIKPDALKLSLTGHILSSLAEPNTGLSLAGAKLVHVTDRLAREHYIEHCSKPFFDNLIEYLTGRIHETELHKRRVVALVYYGENAVAAIRNKTGPTNPHVARKSAPWTIRALGTLVRDEETENHQMAPRIDNLVHASASREDAEREIKLWFKPRDICPELRAWECLVCDEHYYCDSEGFLTTTFRKSFTCLLAPGKPVWESDLILLQDIVANGGRDDRIWRVASKYLINEDIRSEPPMRLLSTASSLQWAKSRRR